ncbi:glycosyltransferase involved in cell wall biosynthesis [Rathayibacter sp. PhB93]|uniref:glycosyltransferase family 2 protein n=1 Tax=unclassified Rathayibacter TaxID=2609250 RepID=UPI000F49947C|nr:MULTISPECIES: glycosyltransferase family 2 protein [unclassified Rathayibacter]ROQ00870.1 glycosyltransferase involved in cell wall biosynthesis [Rathayibacter sp. PhB93]TDQ07224.1 glycosyltransferase involved in cell wall biosynthesis [Rathayibacter sp. PhB1]
MPQNLSIVVPAYNVEAYLPECLASLADRDDVGEVVVVDDGSTDGTLALARAFAASQPRVTVLSEEHRGLSATRNTGVAAAQGEFLAFCDADDRVPAGAYDHLLRALGASGSDFASGDVRRFDSARVWAHPRYRDVFAATRLGTHLTRDPALILDRMSWNKVFRRSFWDRSGLAFQLAEYEDGPVMIEAHLRAASVDVVSEVVYHWRVRESGPHSITQRLHEPANAAARMTMAVETALVLQRLAPELLPELALDIVHGDMRVVANAVQRGTGDAIGVAVARACDFLDLLPPGLLEELSEEDALMVARFRRSDLAAIRSDAPGHDPTGRTPPR